MNVAKTLLGILLIVGSLNNLRAVDFQFSSPEAGGYLFVTIILFSFGVVLILWANNSSRKESN